MAPEPASRPSGQPGQPLPQQRRYLAAGTGLLLGGALGYIALVDPHNAASLYPQCPFKALTGWDCPFCGGLRMTHDLLHGDLAASVHDNVFLLIGLPLLAGWLLFRWRRARRSVPLAALTAIVVTTIGWTVLRNLSGFPLVPTMLSG
ncbi:DUF2752 domain-containing protein [Mycobacterium sherrisii]|uniref:DUF2752 domain-containing protein n=1 Tax=Mycobacterium sherrisii TaxID=243061 RepID=A0A1E3T203_9MYCO|nr:DUF2752 domain-containing protein [Mycobacterium sherrisii]MCV7030426.1 DUF2752 domain-containing protein [Mycobacterium sherrisii]MEC4764741.1 DUF2752 domain-containing protein [Mycobacterium sherrisii]ODR08431.1 hypothetical protein BHQ21_06395 [Mycobacterium sherrisii]ORW75315.1 hypothetical protein AWC25_14035 [Mycobacterium sherrisii]